MLGFRFRSETLYSQHSKILLTECLPLLYILIIYFYFSAFIIRYEMKIRCTTKFSMAVSLEVKISVIEGLSE